MVLEALVRGKPVHLHLDSVLAPGPLFLTTVSLS
jgi:hypothetical protein